MTHNKKGEGHIMTNVKATYCGLLDFQKLS